MKDSPYEMALLLDFYGEMLTDKQRELFDLYHNEDLSLGEIAELQAISRQGVRDTLMRAQNTLISMEDKLGLVARFAAVKDAVGEIVSLSDEILDTNTVRYNNEKIESDALRIRALATGLSD